MSIYQLPIIQYFTGTFPLSSSPLSAYYTPSIANLKNLSRYIQHMTIWPVTTAHRRVVQTIKPSLLQSRVLTPVSPLLAAAFSRRSCLSKRQNGVQRSCHQPNSDSERQQRSNILWSMNRVFKCINVLVCCTTNRRGELQIEWRNIIQPKK